MSHVESRSVNARLLNQVDSAEFYGYAIRISQTWLVLEA